MSDRTSELVEMARAGMVYTEALADLIKALEKRVSLLEVEFTLMVTAIDQHNERLSVMEGD